MEVKALHRLKIGSWEIVYCYGIHIEHFPSGNIYLYQRQYCPSELLPNGYIGRCEGKCPRCSTLWRWYRHFRECNATPTPWLWPFDPSLREFSFPFFLLVQSGSRGLGEPSLTYQMRTSPAAIEQRENMPESKQNEYISPKLSLFSICLISNLDRPLAEVFSDLGSSHYYTVTSL